MQNARTAAAVPAEKYQAAKIDRHKKMNYNDFVSFEEELLSHKVWDISESILLPYDNSQGGEGVFIHLQSIGGITRRLPGIRIRWFMDSTAIESLNPMMALEHASLAMESATQISLRGDKHGVLPEYRTTRNLTSY